jgi:N-acetylmuramoyl-L-alanine amidase
MQESAETITEAAEMPVLEPETETEIETSSESLIEFECLTEYESETEVLRCIEFEDWEYDEFLRVVEAEVTSDSPKGLDYDTALQCKLHVAQVIVNRVKDSRFPDTLHGVIFQSGQFMPTWDGRFWSVEISDSTKEACYKAICEGTEDTTYGSLFFIAGTMRMTGYYVFTDEVGHNFFALD